MTVRLTHDGSIVDLKPSGDESRDGLRLCDQAHVLPPLTACGKRDARADCSVMRPIAAAEGADDRVNHVRVREAVGSRGHA